MVNPTQLILLEESNKGFPLIKIAHNETINKRVAITASIHRKGLLIKSPLFVPSFYHNLISFFTFAKHSTAKSKSSFVCPAEICVRTLAFPIGTTG